MAARETLIRLFSADLHVIAVAGSNLPLGNVEVSKLCPEDDVGSYLVSLASVMYDMQSELGGDAFEDECVRGCGDRTRGP